MPVFEESGLLVTLPGETAFRFCDLSTFKSLSGRQISEMDYAWRHDEKSALCLMEVKDYSAEGRELPKHLLAKLVAKGRDCLVLLRAAWSELSASGRALREELPALCREELPVRLFFVVKGDPVVLKKEGFPFMQDHLRACIEGYAELLGVRAPLVLLIDHEKAVRMGLVSIAPASR